jgi:diguanylate cyclase (GGDEF)-like protein
MTAPDDSPAAPDTGMEDALLFVDDAEDTALVSEQPTWRVLVIDDDPDVHAATRFALSGTRILGRHIELWHAHSAAEARAVLATDLEPAVILLDVVMETPDAGLALIDHIRHDRGLTATRIVLRTGQPGYAPEHETLARYDINDYKSKSEFTQHKLVTTLMAAIRSYEQIRTIELGRRGLKRIVEGSAALLELQGLQCFADGVLTQMAGLIGVAPEGMVCAQGPAPNGPYTILAAAGRYANLINQPLSALADHPAAQRLQRALQSQRSEFDSRETALYIGSRNGLDMAVYLPTGGSLDPLHQQLIDVFCINLSACLGNLALIQRLRSLAYEDSLLAIPNRAYLIDRIDDALGQGLSDLTLALIDIDDFNGINELMGHDFGDRVLQALADRLRERTPTGITLARVAGNAFGLLGPTGHFSANCILNAVGEPLSIDGQPFKIQVSIGVCDAIDFGGRGVNAVKNAAIALKHAKQQHRGGIVRFDRDMAQRSRHHAELLARLNAAFNGNQLFLTYQPQVDLRTRRVIGVEALVRWRRDDGQMVPPDTFIPIAERSGLIEALGTWVLKTACHDMQRLLQLGHLAPTRMAVNVSVIQFGNPRFVAQVEQALAEHGLPPQRLELEITESVAMLGATVVEQALHRLREIGVSVAIDDFGTGYSSLAYLERLPLDRIKIDRTFVRQLQLGQGPRIAAMITELGHTLGLRVLAEGIEDEPVWQQLADIGCHEGQGYHIARPMPFDDLLVWLERWHAPPMG